MNEYVEFEVLSIPGRLSVSVLGIVVITILGRFSRFG